MNKNTWRVTLLALLSLLSLLTCSLAQASVQEFKVKIDKVLSFQPPPAAYLESPFDGYYMLANRNYAAIGVYDEDIHIEMAQNRGKRIDNGRITVMSQAEADEQRTLLFQHIRHDMLIGPFGHGKKKIVLISAPNCPYCRALDQSLNKHLKQLDVAIYIAPTMLGSSKDFLNNVACAPDPRKAWLEGFAKRGAIPVRAACDRSAQIDAVVQLGYRVEPRGVVMPSPFIIFPDGSFTTGFPKGELSLADLKKFLRLE